MSDMLWAKIEEMGQRLQKIEDALEILGAWAQAEAAKAEREAEHQAALAKQAAEPASEPNKPSET